MCDRWPDLFVFPPQPIAVGLGPVMIAALATTPPKGWPTMTYQQLTMAVAHMLEAWTGHQLYLLRTKAGVARVGLNGEPLGRVLKDEETWALEQFRRKWDRELPWLPTEDQLRDWIAKGWQGALSG
jgi:hypothetical protein